MRAFVRTSARSGEVELIERPTPQPGSDEALVVIRAFGVGIHDRYFIPQDGPFPYTIGTEGAGVVAAIGSAVTAVSVGDRVMLTTVMQPLGGTWAEFAVAPQDALLHMPETMHFTTAAGLPIPGEAAVAVLRTLHPASASTLFIGGGSGAIGTLLIQLAHRRGARVAASASPANHAHLRSLGAELAVDYRDPEWPEQVRAWAQGGADAAVAILPGIGTACLSAVRDHGLLVTVSGDPVEPERDIAVEQFQHLAEDRLAFAHLVEEIAAGAIHVEVEHVYDFEETVAALEKTETRHARGKVVVSVGTDSDSEA